MNWEGNCNSQPVISSRVILDTPVFIPVILSVDVLVLVSHNHTTTQQSYLIMASRPELTGHASLFYNQKEAKKYNSSSRMIGVQREITERAIELLRLDSSTPALVLDVGCGSGLSGQVLEEKGHVWLGCDVSRDMLNVANEKQEDNREKEQQMDVARTREEDTSDDDDNEEEDKPSMGDLMHHDMGTGLPFRPATFDACISISALQWLCYSNSKNQNPKKRLLRFFSSLYTVLKRGGRAVLQFYPETADQAVLISETATQVGFAGGVVVDYPNSAKAKKHYLVLSFDRSVAQRAITGKGLTEETPQQGLQQQQHVTLGSTAASSGKKRSGAPKKKKGIKTKEWIVHKKATQRKKGKDVRPDTKYTARKRPHKF
jgi:18S rRNA (guanine1575-N7)-methyltransferase